MENFASSDGSDAISTLSTLRQAFVDRLKNRGVIRTPSVEEAFRTIPRHVFVPNTDRETAYTDIYIVTRLQADVPISSCSQPSITAIMLELLDLQPGQRILEIGAGTGYAAALMAHIVGETGQVVTIDIDEDIVEDARAHLSVTGIENVQVLCADGTQGWDAAAPYDRILLTVGPSDIAPAWREQLRQGGRLVLPLRLTPFWSELAIPPDQFLLALDRTDTCLESVAIRPCAFMPLRGAFAELPAHSVALGPEPGLTCLVTHEIDATTAFAALHGPYHDEATNVRVAFPELGGLRLWLTLRAFYFCELSVKGDLVKESTVPPLLGRTHDFIATFGLYEHGTWGLLWLEEDTVPTTDPKRPFVLTIRRFGPDQALTQHMKEELTLWEQAGHPFVWSPQATMEESLQIRVCPLDTAYSPQAHEILLKKRGSQFLFSPRS